MSVRLLVGDCRAMLATLPDASAHMVCTSPPYYGLRAYGTNPQVWGGDPACSHVWDVVLRRVQSGGTGEASAKQVTSRGTLEAQREVQQGYCTRCAAWRGELGSEPTPDCGQPMRQMKAGLTEKQRAYVLARLAEEGLL